MADWVSRLRALRDPIDLAIVGVGSIGKGLLFQSRLTPGMRCVAVADVRVERAVAAAEAFRIAHRVVRTLDALHDAVRTGALAVCEDGDLVARCESARVLIEASNALAPARQFARRALAQGMDNAGNDGLPICLADGAVLLRDVARDERVRMGDVRFDTGGGETARAYRDSLAQATGGGTA